MMIHGFHHQFPTTAYTASNSSPGWCIFKRVEPQAPGSIPGPSLCWGTVSAAAAGAGAVPRTSLCRGMVSGAIEIDSGGTEGGPEEAQEGCIQSHAKDNYKEVEHVLPRRGQIQSEWQEIGGGTWRREEEVCRMLGRFRVQRAGADHSMQPYVPWRLHCSMGQKPCSMPCLSLCTVRQAQPSLVCKTYAIILFKVMISDHMLFLACSLFMFMNTQAS